MADEGRRSTKLPWIGFGNAHRFGCPGQRIRVLGLIAILISGFDAYAEDTLSFVTHRRVVVDDDLPLLLGNNDPAHEIVMADPPIQPGVRAVDDGYQPPVAENLEGFMPSIGETDSYPVTTTTGSVQSSRARNEWILLPDGLLWHSYLAGPQEPRMSAILCGDEKGNYFWDATLGGRVGFLRYGTPGAKDPHGWQWDLEGAVITRMDLLNQMDVESVDYRFGTELTWAEGPWAMKAGYFHISSHAGDEYLIRNPTFDRINYVTESLIYGISNRPIQPVRLYGEVAYALHRSGGARPFQFQTGAEWTPAPSRPKRLAPFAAANLGFFEATEFHMQTTLQVGWSYLGPQSGRRLRFGLQYGDGPSNQFEFFRRSQEYLGCGIWFDY